MPLAEQATRPGIDPNLPGVAVPTRQIRLETVIAPVEQSPVQRSGSWVPLVMVLIVGLACGLRLAGAQINRSLWIDEAMLALNIAERSPAELLKPLDHNQGAPVGFLLAVKASTSLLGTSELGLRFVPLLGSLIGVFLFTALAYRLLPLPAARLAITLFAVSPYLIGYSAECKQYATDATILMGLFLALLPLLGEQPRRLSYWLAAVAGMGAIWFSHPAVFTLAGVGGFCWIQTLMRKRRSGVLAMTGVILAWLASFAVVYMVNLKQLGSNKYLLDYWAGHFFPLPPKSPGDIAWMLQHFTDLFQYPGGFGGETVKLYGFAATAALIATLALLKDASTRKQTVFLLAPLVVALIVSGLKKYPFGGRMLLFVVPILILLVARGTFLIAERLQSIVPASFALLALLTVGASAAETLEQYRKPHHAEELLPLMGQIRSLWTVNDRLYVYNGQGDSGAGPAFTWYSSRCEFPADAVVLGGIHRGDSRGYLTEMRQLASKPGNVWLLFSHRHKSEEAEIRAYCDTLGERKQVFQQNRGQRVSVCLPGTRE